MIKALKFTLALFTFAALAACAPGARSPEENDGGSPRCPTTISIQNFAFNPAACWVDQGTTLTFSNNNAAPHTATSDPDAAAAFDTGTLQPGQSASVTFSTAGSYPYHCNIHPSMQAAITVRGADGSGASSASDVEGDGGSDSGYGY